MSQLSGFHTLGAAQRQVNLQRQVCHDTDYQATIIPAISGGLRNINGLAQDVILLKSCRFSFQFAIASQLVSRCK